MISAMAASARGLVISAMAQMRASAASSLSASRKCSVKPWFDGSVTDSSADSAGEGSGNAGNRLEQVLHEFRIQKAAPDWLPLLPGRSFWMPPEVKEVKEVGPVVPVLEPASEGEMFAMIMPSGWPAPAPVGGAE